MSDTQWPTFEVFQQEKEGGPCRSVGAVHAPDPELALLNARDVFVRRPNCAAIWVVPTAMILARTAQQLEDPAPPPEPDDPPAGAKSEAYCVFQKQTQKPSDTYVAYVGQVEAGSPAQALDRARQTFAGTTPWVWWICPARAVTRTEAADADSMFGPALNKPYRHPSHYHTVAEMRQIKTGQNPK